MSPKVLHFKRVLTVYVGVVDFGHYSARRHVAHCSEHTCGRRGSLAPNAQNIVVVLQHVGLL